MHTMAFPMSWMPDQPKHQAFPRTKRLDAGSAARLENRMSIKADTHEKSLSIELVPSRLENAWRSTSHTLAARRASTRRACVAPDGQAIGASVVAAASIGRTNRKPLTARNSKAVALVHSPADDPFGRRTVKPVLPFAHAVAVTGQLHRDFRRFCRLGALHGISLPRIRALHSSRIGT
jgi:hypothetical protein